MGFLRPILVLVLLALLVGAALSVWLRLAERRRLARDWEVERRGERGDWVAAGMAAYDRSLRRWLPWAVAALPVAALAVVLYVVND